MAWFEGGRPVQQEVLRHSDEELGHYERVADQRDFRTRRVEELVAGWGRELSELDAVAARGGLLPPVPGGTYLVDEEMVAWLTRAERGEHASNLGALIALDLARRAGAAAYVTDPVSVDEMEAVARLSGFPPVSRESLFHALNIRAVARRHAEVQGISLGELSAVVCHLGTGISVAALRKGRAVDVVNPRDEGPFAMDRAGSVPVVGLLRYLRESGVAPEALERQLFGRGGVFAYLGTRDLREVEARMDRGDARARLVFEALAYQAAKAIGEMAVILAGQARAILLTGGMAHSERLVAAIRDRVVFLAPVFVYPGEDEMLALAEGALRVIEGREAARRLSDVRIAPKGEGEGAGAAEGEEE